MKARLHRLQPNLGKHDARVAKTLQLETSLALGCVAQRHTLQGPSPEWWFSPGRKTAPLLVEGPQHAMANWPRRSDHRYSIIGPGHPGGGISLDVAVAGSPRMGKCPEVPTIAPC